MTNKKHGILLCLEVTEGTAYDVRHRSSVIAYYLVTSSIGRNQNRQNLFPKLKKTAWKGYNGGIDRE